MNNDPAQVIAAPQMASDLALSVLKQCLDRLSSIPGAPQPLLNEWQEKLAARIFNLVVMGEFKRGKTSVINALIDADLLPVGVIPLTSVVTILSYGDSINIEVVFDDDRRETITPEQLTSYVTETGNPHNTRGVREVLIAHPARWLQGGVRLVDTPGIGSVYRHNTDVTYDFLPKADAVLLVLSADQPITQGEYNFLKEIREYAAKVFVLLNKADLLKQTELEESIAFTRRAITEAMGSSANLFPISARQARDGSSATTSTCGFQAFSRSLSTFLQHDKGQVLVISIARGLSRTVTQLHASTGIELKSLNTPLIELQQKIQAFELKKVETTQARNDYLLLLKGESKNLPERIIDADVREFAPDLVQRIDARIVRYYQENRKLSSRALRAALRQRVISEIREAYDVRIREKEIALSQAFEAVCGRFAVKLNELVDDLFRFSSALFNVQFDAVGVESSWNIKSEFSYKFWEEPAALSVLISSFMLALPKFIAGPWLLNEAQRYLNDSVDAQAGRLRHDLTQRLYHSEDEFETMLLERIDATIVAIEQAVKKGIEMSQAGEQQIAQVRQDFSARIEMLNEIRIELDEMLKSVEVT